MKIIYVNRLNFFQVLFSQLFVVLCAAELWSFCFKMKVSIVKVLAPLNTTDER